MNKTVALSLLALFLFANAQAQFNRNNTKSSNVYRRSYQRVAAGQYSTTTLEIRGGTLWAWGNGGNGQMGDGTNNGRTTPAQVGTDTRWVSVSAGKYHVLGLKSDGTLWSWGGNGNGQLGDGTGTSRNTPVQIGTDTKWTSVSAGTEHSLALKSDGTLWSWGKNLFGQLGNGTTNDSNVPVQIGTDNKWVTIAAGDHHSAAIKSDGTLWTVGNNNNGELGYSTALPYNNNNFAQVGGDRWVSVVCGTLHTVALKNDGTLWTWGEDNLGQLGDGGTNARFSPYQVGSDNKWMSVAAGYGHSMGLKSDGTLWAWGYGEAGQLGNGSGSSVGTPTQVGTDTKWVAIAAGLYQSMGVKSDGSLWTWGANAYGQLGDGTATPRGTLAQVTTSPRDWLQVSQGSQHTVALKSDGTLWTWGRNAEGQLGDGTITDKLFSQQIGTDNKWISVAAGGYHDVGLKSDGTLWAWGKNASGQLGDGTTTNRTTPVQIGTDNKWTSITAGTNHTAALKSDGTIWAWGENSLGQLGDGTYTDRAAPVQIVGDVSWVSITAGSDHTVALRTNGTLWSWGDNAYGELGRPTNGTNSNTSGAVSGTIDLKWVSMVAGDLFTLALKSDGTLWAWGRNTFGQIGDGTNTNRSAPVQIGTDNKWTSIFAGAQHAAALKNDGTFWSWGGNTYGQLGDGTTTDKNAPIQIASQANVVAMSRGSASSTASVVVKSDRTGICITGTSTTLGNGTYTASPNFICDNCNKYSVATASITAITAPLAGTGNRTDFHSNCVIAASVTPSGASPASGTVTARIINEPSVQRYNGMAYVTRHYDILPAANAATATATITLYFTQDEFTAYNAANGTAPDLPTGPADAAGIANVRVSQFHGTPSGGYAPANYPTTWGGAGPARVLLTPTSVTWNPNDSYWQVTVNVIGFSGFFLHTTLTNSVLPVTWLSLSGKLNPLGETFLQWAVEERDVADYTVEKSEDGLRFVGIGSVQSLGNGRNNYAFVENTGLTGTAFYRVRQTDINGRISYSKTILLSSKKEGALVASLYPNPVQSAASLEVHTPSAGTLNYQVTDAVGRQLQSGSFVVSEGVNVLTLPTTMLPKGVYLWQGNLNGQALSLRFMKQ